MNEPQTTYVDARPAVRTVLAALWTSTLFMFAYVDIFTFFRADVIKGALAGKVSGPGFEINQGFLLLTTLYIVVPSLMIAGTMLLRANLARMLNLVISGLYFVSIVVSAVGEHWAYYLVGSAVECALLAAIAVVARGWPRQSVPRTGDARGHVEAGDAVEEEARL